MKDRAKKILIFVLGASVFPKITETLVSFIIDMPYSIYGICSLLYIVSYAIYPIIIKDKNELNNVENIFYFSGIYFSITSVFIFILVPIIFSL